VKSVNIKAKTLSVTNQPIPGSMGAMTMTYTVNDPVLSRLKPGDRISAKLRASDMNLYDVQILSADVTHQESTAHQLGLTELERIALSNNPTVAQEEANIRVAAGLATQAGLYPNPTVGYYGDEIRGGYIGAGQQGGFVSQTIVTGGKLRAARRVADLHTKQAETSRDAQHLRILNDVRALFYQLLGDQQLEDVRKQLVDLASEAVRTSHQLANVGQSDRPDVLQAEVEEQQAILGLHVAEQNVRASWRTLAAVIGKPELPQTRVAGDMEVVPDLSYDESLGATLRESPGITLAQQRVDLAEASFSQARRAAIPDLQLYGNLSQNNEPLDTTHKATGLNGGVQIGVQLPIFNRNQGNVAAARAEVERAKAELARLRLEIARDLASQFRDYESARATVQQYKNEILPRAEMAYKLYQTNYRNMAAAYPQVIISQRFLFQLEIEHVQALKTAWRSALVIRGFGLMDGLSSPASVAVSGDGRIISGGSNMP
jgi:outer membrane protein, heavy metal efflux system